jgi:replicative DNA helicase
MGYEPPNNIDAEQCVLSAMMLDTKAIPVVASMIGKNDFYRPAHGEIYEAIWALFQEKKPADTIMVQEELRKRGILDECGGQEYLMAIIYQLPSSSRAEYYAEIVKDKSELRELAKLGREIHADCFLTNTTAAESREMAITKLLSLNNKTARSGLVKVAEVVTEVHEDIDKAVSGESLPLGLMTGIRSVDSITTGLQVGLNVIAARPSAGKTALMLQIARNNNVPIAFFSLETTAKQLVRRLITAGTGVSNYQMRRGFLDEEEINIVTDTVNTIYNMPFYIYDKGCDISRIIAMSNRAKLQYGIGAVMVDYLQLITTRGNFGSREQEVTYIARSLHDLSMQLDIPVIAASQLKRLPEARRMSKPSKDDLRESGEIEAVAYCVILLHNPKPEIDEGSPRDASIIIAKYKDGTTSDVDVKWEGKRITFYDIETRHEEDQSDAEDKRTAYWRK